MRRMFFFRDDDIFDLNSNFLRVHNFFMRENIPMNYAIIPARLEKEAADFLISEKMKRPKLLDFLQHGFKHENYGNSKKKFEFGGPRKYSEQKNDITEGKKIMKDFFGEYYTNVFIPPFHGFNRDTLKAVIETGFWGFSSTFLGEMPKGILNLPVFNFEVDGLKSFISDFEKFHKRFETFGVCIHHDNIDEKGLKKLEMAIKLLRSINNLPSGKLNFKFVTLSEVKKSYMSGK